MFDSPSGSDGGIDVFVSNFVPVSDIRMAPSGAVTTIAKIQTINTTSPWTTSSWSGAKCFNATGPNAACTVAFAIHEIATNT